MLLFPVPTHRPSLQSRHLSKEDWPCYGTMHWSYSNCQWLLHPWQWTHTAWCLTASLLESCSPNGLVLSINKYSIAKQQITFFGNIYDQHRCHPDPEKAEAIHAIPQLRNCTQLQEFLGMITWLAPFIHNMSDSTATLWELLCKVRVFTWNKTYSTAFHHIKQLIYVDVTLCHYDVNFPMEVHVDASLCGLGAALVQMASQLPMLPRHSHPQSSIMPILRESYLPLSLE